MTHKLRITIFIFGLFTLVSCRKTTDDKNDNHYDSAIIDKSKQMFDKARQLQYNQNFNQAIVTFKLCLKFQGRNRITCDSLYNITSNAMLQLMNSYQECGKIKECANYFAGLYAHPTPMIRQYCMRDLCSIYAYALYRYDKMDEAKKMIQKTLKMKYANPTHEAFFRDYSYAAAIYFCDSRQVDLVMKYGSRALKESEKCEHTSGVQWLNTVLAYNYDRIGEIDKAISLHERAIKVAKDKRDTLGVAHAYMALSSIYIEWGMPSYANDCASLAILNMKEENNRYPDIAASAYISKATALKSLEKYDSMYTYLNEAKKFTHELPYGDGMSSVEYLEGSTIIERGGKQSVIKGIKLLKNVAENGPEESKTKAFYSLSKAYFKLGDNRSGEMMLDSMYNVMHQSSKPTYLSGAYLYALNHYIKKNDAGNIVRYAKAFAEESKFHQNQQTARKLANLFVQINTENKEQQLVTYKTQVENEKLRLDIFIYVFIAILLLSAPIILYKRKMRTMRYMLMSERFDKLNEEMQNETKKHLETQEQLSALIHRRGIDDPNSHISPAVINDKGESEFRTNFMIKYPHFIPQLKELSDNLSHRDELLCMLIAHNQDNGKISDLLCIAYRSVVVAKYRLKQKLGLKPEDNLDELIKQLLQKGSVYKTGDLTIREKCLSLHHAKKINRL